MKKAVMVLGIVTLASTAHAGGAALCPAIEFAELQTYSDKELSDLSIEYFHKLAQSGPGGEFYNPRSSIEGDNCNTQLTRINRVTKARREAQQSKN